MRLNIQLKRVLLLGGGGLLGSAIQRIFKAAEVEVLAPGSGECDLRDLTALSRCTREVGPDLIINSAAISSVDGVEEAPEEAYRVNTIGAHNAAMAAAGAEIPLVHISSDYVFDGTSNEPYCEFHPTGVPPNRSTGPEPGWRIRPPCTSSPG